jgi:hypothetical protein
MELRNIPKEERPDFKDWLYWVPYIVWPVLAGLLVFAYEQSGTPLSPILGLNVGVSAPLIFRQMVKSNPFGKNRINPGKGA